MASPVVDGRPHKRAANNSTSVFKGVFKEAPPTKDMDGSDAIKPPWRHHRRGRNGRRHRRSVVNKSCYAAVGEDQHTGFVTVDPHSSRFFAFVTACG